MRHKLTGKALVKLIGKVGYRWSDNDDTIHYFGHDDNFVPPTEKQIESKITELEAEYDAKSYARARESQYPSITDVVVALAEKEEGDDTAWQEITAQRAKVKADNPKPS